MQVNIHEAKSQLSRLIQLTLEGEEVIIARNNQPLIRLQPLQTTVKKRQLGSLKGLVRSISPDFDASLDDFEDYRV